jgi:hypothetical protein
MRISADDAVEYALAFILFAFGVLVIIAGLDAAQVIWRK